jgi:hypothetical protein
MFGALAFAPPASHAADYSHGDACAAAGAFHQTNDSSGMDFLICDGSNWKSALSFSSAGNNLRIDNDPAAGDAGCIRYDGTGGKMQFSHDCSSYSDFGTGSSGLWSDSGSGYIEYTGTLGGIKVAPVLSLPAPDGATSAGGGGGGGGLWTAGSGDDIYYNTGTPLVGIGKSDPGATLDIVGDIHYTGVIQDVSDRRLKTDIRSLTPGQLEKLTALQAVSFRMKSDPEGRTELGLIAQDVEPVFPELVRESGSGTLSLNYSGLIAPMIEAIKELKAESEMLKAENEMLKARLDALEQQQQSGEQ